MEYYYNTVLFDRKAIENSIEKRMENRVIFIYWLQRY